VPAPAFFITPSSPDKGQSLKNKTKKNTDQPLPNDRQKLPKSHPWRDKRGSKGNNDSPNGADKNTVYEDSSFGGYTDLSPNSGVGARNMIVADTRETHTVS